MLELCFTPVSGGYFVSQTAALSKILEARERSSKIKKTQFDAYFGASGGNLANLISIFFFKNSESMEKILYNINSRMFVKKPTKMNTLLSIFKSGLYEEGDVSVYKVFSEILEEEIFMKKETPEIWTLSYNINTNLGALSCSKNKEESIFKDCITIEEILNSGCGEVNYLEGSLKKILETTLASASIPGVKPHVEIEGNEYIDGGVNNSTPGGCFSEIIYKKIKNKEFTLPLHYFFFLPVDIKNINERQALISKRNNKHWIGKLFESLKSFITSTIFTDKRFLLEHWKRTINFEEKNSQNLKYYNIGMEELTDVLEKFHNKNYFATIYTDINKIEIIDFDFKDLKKIYQKSYKNLNLEIIIN